MTWVFLTKEKIVKPDWRGLNKKQVTGKTCKKMRKRRLNYHLQKKVKIMEIRRILPDGKTTFVMEAATPKEAFSKLALVDELFSEKECGCCHSADIKFVQRKVENGFYLEMRCQKCGAQLAYGQNKEGGGIFVKKWDSEKRCAMPNGGWYIYQKQGDSHEQPSRGNAHNDSPPPPQDGDIPF